MNRGTCEIVGILEPLRFESLCDPETTSTITTNGERLTDYVRVLPVGRSVVPRGNRTLNRMIMIERINKCDPPSFHSRGRSISFDRDSRDFENCCKRSVSHEFKSRERSI